MVFQRGNLALRVLAEAVAERMAIQCGSADEWGGCPFGDQFADTVCLEGPMQLVGENFGGRALLVSSLVFFQRTQGAVDGLQQEGLATAIGANDQVDTSQIGPIQIRDWAEVLELDTIEYGVSTSGGPWSASGFGLCIGQ